jgi:thioredoxin-like negative regulator of GroEL
MCNWNRQRIRRLIVLSLLLTAIGWAVWRVKGNAGASAARLLREARAAYAAGDVSRAGESAEAAWRLDPALGEAALLAARCAADLRRYDEAVQLAEHVSSDDQSSYLRAALLRARIERHHLYRFRRAEEAYEAALRVEPDNLEANQGLAQLLGICARREEAVTHVLQLVRQGVPTDLLVMIARDTGVASDPDALSRARQNDPQDPNPLIGLAWQDANAGRVESAIDVLREAVTLQPEHAAAQVALGRQLLADNRYQELLKWAGDLPAAADDLGESWIIRAQLAEHANDAPGAVRCYLEAARRIPESKRACTPLVRLLAAAGDRDAAARFSEHVQSLQRLDDVQNRVLFGDADVEVGALLELAHAYEQAGRRWEACGWCLIAAQGAPGHPGVQSALREAQRRTEGIPLRMTVDGDNVALAVDLSSYPLPNWGRSPGAVVATTTAGAAAYSFREDAANVGLRFRFVNGIAGPPTRRMYEFTGGGVAALDYDRDGFPDLYFTQGCIWPPGTSREAPGDQLFANRHGTVFADVSSQASIEEQDFSQGVTAGDFDGDGFPDLYVANIGPNRLWRNNGDGTFTDVSAESGLATAGTGSFAGASPSPQVAEWTTSCVLADLNGDRLPDIYDVNYVTAPDVFERVCARADGSPVMCMPFDFDSQPDRLWLNLGDGRFEDATEEVFTVPPGGTGLGVAVWDAHGEGRLSVLVANDATPNFLFEDASPGDGRFHLEDRALVSGVALNADAKATGCMGVALGDVDGDGGVDLHITNFLAEPNTLFMHLADGTYSDRSRELGLHGPSFGVLGFGTQFLDADLDGQLELFVANGHVDDLRAWGRPYRMPPQYFHWHGGGFTQVDPAGLGEYFRQEWLGRAAARLDWNRDGLEDLVIGHLDDDSALLTNSTPPRGNWLALRLVGMASERDAIGAMVTARIGGRKIMRQLTAGDGYQASNERTLSFGLGRAESIDELEVRWPSGIVQRFRDQRGSCDTVLVEGGPLLISPR